MHSPTTMRTVILTPRIPICCVTARSWTERSWSAQASSRTSFLRTPSSSLRCVQTRRGADFRCLRTWDGFTIVTNKLVMPYIKHRLGQSVSLSTLTFQFNISTPLGGPLNLSCQQCNIAVGLSVLFVVSWQDCKE